MNVSKSGAPSSSSLSDIKVLLEVVNNSDKLKAAMKALEDRADVAEAAEKEANKAKQELAALQKELIGKQEELSKAASSLEATAASVTSSAASLNDLKASLAQREKDFLRNVEAFAKYKDEETKTLMIKQSAADSKMASAEELSKKSKSLIADHEQKISKLKAAMN